MKKIILVGISALIITGFFAVSPAVHAAQPAVDLKTAAPFAILAGTPGITDAANASTITGNVGLSPATGAGIGLLCSQVTGTIYSVDAAGPLPCRITDGSLLVTAKNDLTAAFIDVAGRTPVSTVPTELGGTTKTPGVYDSSSTTFQITAGAGPLVLDAQNDPTAVFIFEMGFAGTGLTVGPGSQVTLINGAEACNVYWKVDTASIDTTAVFKGNILALNSITVNSGANIQGRLLARNGTVTLDTDTIVAPTTCSTAAATSTTPGLPNTGSYINSIWSVAIPAIIASALVALYLARKKWAIRSDR